MIKWKALCLVLFLSLPVSAQYPQHMTEEEKGLFEAFLTAYQLIKDQSIHTNHTQPQELIMSAISGMVNSLEDPYSILLRGKALDRFYQNIDNHYSGIGIYIVTNERGILIVDVIPDSPAWTIGLQSQDIITKVGGMDIKNKKLDEVKALIVGPEKSLVEITISRGDEELVFNVLRESVQVRTVQTKTLPEDKSIAYIRILNFAQSTSKEFSEALEWVKSQRATGLVIDVRNNPGGLLPVVIEMVDTFIAKGTVVSTRSVNAPPNLVTADPQIDIPTFIPVAVLVNRYSASASEIFAGALKDHHRAVIVGENSFGKFSVQKLFSLLRGEEENAVLKLTIARYFLPSGDSFDKVGIAPHVEVDSQPKSATGDNSKESQGENTDPVIDAALTILNDFSRYRQLLEL